MQYNEHAVFFGCTISAAISWQFNVHIVLWGSIFIPIGTVNNEHVQLLYSYDEE